MDKGEVGKLIRRERRLQEISVKDMAAAAGVSKQYIHKIENGEANPTMDVLDKIFSKLGISIMAHLKQ